MYEALVARVRYHIQKANFMGLKEAESTLLLAEAADAIEQLVKDLERSKEWEAFWEKEANEALKKFQTTVASIPRWIPVTEALPDFEGCLLCMRKAFVGDNLRYQDILYYDEDGFHMEFEDTPIPTEAVTHWMQLPPAPKEET